MLVRRKKKQQGKGSGSSLAEVGGDDIRRGIEAHYEAHLGKPDTIWREPRSNATPIDVFVWRPTEQRPMYTMATAGMSVRPMNVPVGARAAGHADRGELMICMPPGGPEPRRTDAPIQWLKRMARFPHDYGRWIGFGQTIAAGDLERPLFPRTSFCGSAFMPPMSLAEDFERITLSETCVVSVLGLIALHEDELECARVDGIDALFAGFDRDGVNELLDINRTTTL